MPSSVVYVGGSGSLVFLDNIAGPSQYGIFGAGASEGQPTLDKLTSSDVRFNVLVGRPESLYPTPNYFPATTAEVGFVDAAQHDYRLAPSSPYIDKSSTSGPVGADVEALMARAAGVAP